MSAALPLLGDKRKWPEWSILVANDPGCVKTCAHEKRAELFSLLSCPGNRRQRFCFSNRLKSRRNFRSQIQFRSFHAAKTRSSHGQQQRRGLTAYKKCRSISPSRGTDCCS